MIVILQLAILRLTAETIRRRDLSHSSALAVALAVATASVAAVGQAVVAAMAAVAEEAETAAAAPASLLAQAVESYHRCGQPW